MIKVYNFRCYDPKSDQFIIPNRKSTRERIMNVRCEIIEGTEEEVRETDLDEEGRYIAEPEIR